jgi:hypothetical protein
MSHLVPDWSRPVELVWGVDQIAPADGWLYAEAKNGEGASHPENHSSLTVNGFRFEISCGGCDWSGLAHHASVFTPVRRRDQFKAEHGSHTKLVFLGIRE